jgi:DNA-binding response OmpR family regulator
LFVEDEATLSLLLRERLEREGYSVESCSDGNQGLARALVGSFDLLLLDIKLPGKDGLEICRQLRRHKDNVPILMLTARGDVRDRVKGLKIGADDYLTKPFDVGELLARIEALIRRASNVPAECWDSVVQFGDVIVNLEKGEVLRGGKSVALTAMEFELLRYFASNPNERLSRQVLLERVWGYKPLVNSRTVDIHVAQLRRKLEPNPEKPRHILTVFRSGYKFVPLP